MKSQLVNRLTTIALTHFRVTADKAAATDGLTDLINRRAFDILFRQTAKSCYRANRRISLALFGIDELNQISAGLGPASRDQAIKAVAGVVKAHSRPDDIICRWEDEEILLLLRNCGLDDAMTIADAVRKNIEQLTILAGRQTIMVTVSAGVAEVSGEEGEESALARAGDGLAAAKHAGHNCVISTNRF